MTYRKFTKSERRILQVLASKPGATSQVYAADGRVSQHRDGKVAHRAAERAIAAGRESVIVYEVA